MSFVGLLGAPVGSHLMSLVSLGQELLARGHRVVVYNIPDTRQRVESRGLAFVSVGDQSHPLGTLPRSLQQLGQLRGLRALRFTVREISGTTKMLCEDLPAALRKDRPDLLLIDQQEPAAICVAQHLEIPYVTFANALMVNREPDIPPFFTSWRFQRSVAARARNRLGYLAFDHLTRPIRGVLDEYRARCRLPKITTMDSLFSPLAQLAQEFEEFDFPRVQLTPVCHRVGPYRHRTTNESTIEFPWERLDGRPLIYVSFGTQQNQLTAVYHRVASACVGLEAQVVISLGGGDADLGELAGAPIVVRFAPQTELLKHASVVVTHGGLNTALESLAAGVPMLVMPITNDQPGVAARIRHCGAGRVLSIRTRNPKRIRSVIQSLLCENQYRDRSDELSEKIARSGGVRRAIDIVEQVVETGSKVERD